MATLFDTITPSLSDEAARICRLTSDPQASEDARILADDPSQLSYLPARRSVRAIQILSDLDDRATIEELVERDDTRRGVLAALTTACGRYGGPLPAAAPSSPTTPSYAVKAVIADLCELHPSISQTGLQALGAGDVARALRCFARKGPSLDELLDHLYFHVMSLPQRHTHDDLVFQELVATVMRRSVASRSEKWPETYDGTFGRLLADAWDGPVDLPLARVLCQFNHHDADGFATAMATKAPFVLTERAASLLREENLDLLLALLPHSDIAAVDQAALLGHCPDWDADMVFAAPLATEVIDRLVREQPNSIADLQFETLRSLLQRYPDLSSESRACLLTLYYVPALVVEFLEGAFQGPHPGEAAALYRSLGSVIFYDDKTPLHWETIDLLGAHKRSKVVPQGVHEFIDACFSDSSFPPDWWAQTTTKGSWLAAEIARRFELVCGTDPDAWRLLAGLFPDWSGSLEALCEATEAIAADPDDHNRAA